MASKPIKPGGIPAYIAACPKKVQPALKSVRAAIRSVAPDAIETLSYFKFPGYHYRGDYAYNGMFAWFSYKEPNIRLHVWPKAIQAHAKDLADYRTTTGIINFSADKKIPLTLIKKLVRSSLKILKESK